MFNQDFKTYKNCKFLYYQSLFWFLLPQSSNIKYLKLKYYMFVFILSLSPSRSLSPSALPHTVPPYFKSKIRSTMTCSFSFPFSSVTPWALHPTSIFGTIWLEVFNPLTDDILSFHIYWLLAISLFMLGHLTKGYLQVSEGKKPSTGPIILPVISQLTS